MTVGYYLDRKIGIRIDIHLDVPIKIYGANYFLDCLSEKQFKDLISDFRDGGSIGFKLEQRRPSKFCKYCFIQNMRKYGEDYTRLVYKIEDSIKSHNITFEELIDNMWKELSVRRGLLNSCFYLGRPGTLNLLGLYAAGYHNINMLNKKYKYLR